MATNLVVLTPNGRRQNVKVTPNTTILQVIEEACTKQGFIPDNYDIKHQRKILDPSTTIRFSGLPNNAFLELVEIVNKRIESNVTILIQLENGTRLTGHFHPSTDLYSIIETLSPEDVHSNKSPVLIYTRVEVFGHKLRETTLRSLGLTGGRALFRLIHRSPEELRFQANVSAPLPSKPVEEKPYVRKLQSSLDPQDNEKTKRAEQTVSTGNTDHSKEPKSVLGSPPGKPECKKPKTDLVNMIKQEKNKKLETSKNTTSRKESDKCGVKDPELIFLGDRNAMLFSLESAAAFRTEDLPDDFFELTITDARKLFRDMQRQRLELEQGGQLQTAAMRRLDEDKKQLRCLEHYKKTVLRIQFPEGLVLQGTFKSTETIETVMHFVRDYLEDKRIEFYLFTTPPQEILSKPTRLYECGCVPGALLHFGSESKRDNYLRSDLKNRLTTPSLASYAAQKARLENRPIKNTIPTDEELRLLAQNVQQTASDPIPGPSWRQDEDATKHVNLPAPKEKLPKWFPKQ